jgi:hypothetical protein
MAEFNGVNGSSTVDVVQGDGTADNPNRYYPLVKIKDILVTSAGEDVTNDLQKVEHRYTSAFVQSDTAVKSAPGFLHTVTFSCADAAPTAGSITIYDNTAASGTKIFEHTFTTTPFMPFSILLDVSVTIGIYVDFTTTADVNVTLSYR